MNCEHQRCGEPATEFIHFSYHNTGGRGGIKEVKWHFCLNHMEELKNMMMVMMGGHDLFVKTPKGDSR